MFDGVKCITYKVMTRFAHSRLYDINIVCYNIICSRGRHRRMTIIHDCRSKLYETARSARFVKPRPEAVQYVQSVRRKIRTQLIVYGIYYNTIILSSAQQLYVYI